MATKTISCIELFWPSLFFFPPRNEPPRDKTNKMTVRPSKSHISLGIRPVWSESLLSARRKLGSLATHWAHSEDSDQTGRMRRLIWVVTGRTCHFVDFVMRWLILHFYRRSNYHCWAAQSDVENVGHYSYSGVHPGWSDRKFIRNNSEQLPLLDVHSVYSAF